MDSENHVSPYETLRGFTRSETKARGRVVYVKSVFDNTRTRAKLFTSLKVGDLVTVRLDKERECKIVERIGNCFMVRILGKPHTNTIGLSTAFAVGFDKILKRFRETEKVTWT